MSPDEKRHWRIEYLTKMVRRMSREGIEPKLILKKLEDKAHDMAGHKTAINDIETVIRRVK